MIHPETGEVLETREQFQAAFDDVAERMRPLYNLRWALRDGMVETFDPPAMPPARSRTQVQERVARCSRCGVKLESEEAAD